MNELLNCGQDTTVMHFDAGREDREDGRASATATLVARNSAGLAQEYPAVDRER